MVVKITTPQSILRALNYNENKVKSGAADLIHAETFLLDAKHLNFDEKLSRFMRLIELSTRAKTNSLHISLNFDPKEKFSKEKLKDIACNYMKKIGFQKQPFLVYQHFDAGHPHIHIVTTSIQENGKRIDTFNIGRNQSEKARKEIEEEYKLVKANSKERSEHETINPIAVQKIKYGHTETKRSISNVLNHVVHEYKYTSLAELNAVLKLFNVLADRGNEEGRIYKNRGLLYRIVDESGNKIGVPVKASSIFFKPTLSFLENKFIQNESLKKPDKSKIRTSIEWTLSKNPKDIFEFVSQLQKERITAVLRKNEDGFIYGITFIDHRTKSVFNGSDVGKEYSASAIQKRINSSTNRSNTTSTLLEKETYTANKNSKESFMNIRRQDEEDPTNENVSKSHSTLDDLLTALMKKERNDSRIPFDLLKKKKKRRKPKL